MGRRRRGLCAALEPLRIGPQHRPHTPVHPVAVAVVVAINAAAAEHGDQHRGATRMRRLCRRRFHRRRRCHGGPEKSAEKVIAAAQSSDDHGMHLVGDAQQAAASVNVGRTHLVPELLDGADQAVKSSVRARRRVVRRPSATRQPSGELARRLEPDRVAHAVVDQGVPRQPSDVRRRRRRRPCFCPCRLRHGRVRHRQQRMRHLGIRVPEDGVGQRAPQGRQRLAAAAAALDRRVARPCAVCAKRADVGAQRPAGAGQRAARPSVQQVGAQVAEHVGGKPVEVAAGRSVHRRQRVWVVRMCFAKVYAVCERAAPFCVARTRQMRSRKQTHAPQSSAAPGKRLIY